MQQPDTDILFAQSVKRTSKERKLNQHAKAIWFTGLPCSGKTTLAIGLEKELFARGFHCQILDGDNVRIGVNSDLGFKNDDRFENIRRIAEISKLFLSCGIITINAFVSPTHKIRNQAREIIGDHDFIEIFLAPTLSSCEQRDVKGMYKKARAGQIPDFTGIDSPFEVPENPSLVIYTDTENIETSLNQLVNKILPIITLNH